MFPIQDLNHTRTTPVLTLAVILANVLVFFLWQPQGNPQGQTEFLYANAAVPCEVTKGAPLSVGEINAETCIDPSAATAAFPDKQVPLSVVTSLFLHGGLLHLAGNMWFLWIFGNNVEEVYSHLGYAVLYLVAGIAATLAFVALNPASTIPIVGASGAIAGVLGSYLVLFPRAQVLALVGYFVLPVPAVLFLGLWFFSQFAVQQPGVAWQAHAAGFIAGAAASLTLRGWLRARVQRVHRSRR
ncbi:MAG: rhomboid family intramembrane serine protease [Dehalococcoidia bacterium]|nr:rhomboid family intramembrane serine protease [Dehalococcoidia bacterium]